VLPFLKAKKEGSMSESDTLTRSVEDYDILESAAADLIKAVKEGNIKDVASALRASFQICESEPYEE